MKTDTTKQPDTTDIQAALDREKAYTRKLYGEVQQIIAERQGKPELPQPFTRYDLRYTHNEAETRRIIASVNNAQALAEALRELSDQTQLARKYIVLDDDNGLAAYHATAKAWLEATQALANWEKANQ